MDSCVLYYPLTHWVHDHIPRDKLPLICDLAYHGAPVAAISMAGVLSPVLWLLHSFSSLAVTANLVFLAPFPIFLAGTYFLGRGLGLTASASLLLCFLWTYNGQRMAQLDHWNVAWACAFFPWAFLSLLRYRERRDPFWLLWAGFLWGLGLLSGHPQVFFLEGLFFLFWVTLSPSRPAPGPRTLDLAGLALGALLTASPLILFTLECHGTGDLVRWSGPDLSFHSWTPLNFLTLLFPWFFGRETFDHQGDYWWQYQFVEMQVAFSLAGLFLMVLFFRGTSPHRRWIGWTASFGVLAAFGKFFFLYPLLQHLPVFSWFRDPARYWHLSAWALGLGAAHAWDEWFKEKHPHPRFARPLPSREREKMNSTGLPSPLRGEGRVRVNLMDEHLFKTGRNLALGMACFSFLLILMGWLLTSFGRPLLTSWGAWSIAHFLQGDGIHTQPLSVYLGRLPEKLAALSLNLDPRQPRVFLPLLFSTALAALAWNRKKWDLNLQKGLLLLLVFADLMCFRMPLGDSLKDPSLLPQPAYPPPQNRSLVLLSQKTWPSPEDYGIMAHPNMNLVFGYPNLVFDANPGLASYDKIAADLGWFSWVYKDRDPMGFTHHMETLRTLGIDQIVSDIPLKLEKTFSTIQDHYPFTYKMPYYPKASIFHQGFLSWDLTTGKSVTWISSESNPKVLSWGETRISASVTATTPPTSLSEEKKNSILIPPSAPTPEEYPEDYKDKTPHLNFQKTFLPGWKATVNGKPARIQPFHDVLISVHLEDGGNLVVLKYDPSSLRMGFFLFFLFSGTLVFGLLRLRTA